MQELRLATEVKCGKSEKEKLVTRPRPANASELKEKSDPDEDRRRRSEERALTTRGDLERCGRGVGTYLGVD